MSGDPRLPDLFTRASELAGAERQAWLEDLRREEASLAREVEELLAAASQGERRFAKPALDCLTPAGGSPAILPERVGPYSIVREIGRGGMGRVFLAEQEEEDFHRRVALKVVARPGFADENVRRFRDEVRILATLEHPGIARFLDGGRDSDGTWYLAMEYVEGEDLIAYARGRGLDLRQRVELFLQVADAVDFAHRRLVVHRDLKPANVLVGADGRARLLDFGVSKILDPEAGEDATRTELRAFTPAYASPEQLRGERATVAADVYSLGVMLYELLAGRRPFERRGAAAIDLAALELDPEPPSTVARQSAPATGGVADTAATLVRWRDLAGDLDAITLRALRAEAEGRYASAAAFAEDLRRWLEGRPVAARRGGRRYRFAKFAARHRVALAAAAAVLVTLGIGVSLALVQRSRALAAQARAEASVADLHRLTQSMLFGIYEQVRQLPSSLAVSGMIAQQATEVLDRLAASAGDDPRLLADLASGYERLGWLYTDHPAMRRSLNRPQAAVNHYARAVEIRQRLAAAPTAGFAERLAVAKSMDALARARLNTGDKAGAMTTSAEVIQQLRALAAEAPDPGAVSYWLAVAHGHAALGLERSRAPAAAVNEDKGAAARYWLEFLAAPSPSSLAEERFASETYTGTRMLRAAGYPEQALRLSGLALAVLDRAAGSRRESMMHAKVRTDVLDEQVDTLRSLGRLPEALRSLKELRRLRAARPSDPDALLQEVIMDMLASRKAADLAAEAGDFDYAASALTDAERRLARAEQQFGQPAFASARVELEFSRSDVLARRADLAPSPRERRRLLSRALATMQAALEAAGQGSGAHGISAGRLAERRREKERIEAALRRGGESR